MNLFYLLMALLSMEIQYSKILYVYIVDKFLHKTNAKNLFQQHIFIMVQN